MDDKNMMWVNNKVSGSETMSHNDKQEHELHACKDKRIYCSCNKHRIFGKYRDDSLKLANHHLDEVEPERINQRDGYASRTGNKVRSLT